MTQNLWHAMRRNALAFVLRCICGKGSVSYLTDITVGAWRHTAAGCMACRVDTGRSIANDGMGTRWMWVFADSHSVRHAIDASACQRCYRIAGSIWSRSDSVLSICPHAR